MISLREQYKEYIDDVAKALEILFKDICKIGSFPIDICARKRKVLSSNVVCDCLYFKNVVEPPQRFVKIQNQINKACDIYLDFYSQLCERVADDDLIWVKHFAAKLIWANRVVVETTKVVSKIK